MAVPTFYAFTNPESHAFFLWLTDHSGIDVADLVARAMGDVEHDSDYALFGDVSRTCRAILAHRLNDTLRDLCSEAVGHDPDDPPDLGREGSTLVANLLAFAVGNVDTESVAEAILRRKRPVSLPIIHHAGAMTTGVPLPEHLERREVGTTCSAAHWPPCGQSRRESRATVTDRRARSPTHKTAAQPVTSAKLGR